MVQVIPGWELQEGQARALGELKVGQELGLPFHLEKQLSVSN